jgi:hypothetical protein
MKAVIYDSDETRYEVESDTLLQDLYDFNNFMALPAILRIRLVAKLTWMKNQGEYTEPFDVDKIEGGEAEVNEDPGDWPGMCSE